ncbi:DUF1330 domain-containing protein [Methylomonas methanica]|uniref:DUF1330 domain-containing protein n=1 Tax=Methylomonas methanica (strain DSM 25384 / MC09) TaxID=857087 RepID=G0A2Z8_METMM|nr:DUF1330 domain-containing protein [Methylomonas methanica]AEG02657.1 protein of unknown function DUF1330 [Methylomonas methanica MC09]
MKGYLVLDLAIKNLEEFLEYAERIPAQIEKHKGKYIVKGVVPEKIEGNWLPERLVVLEFASEKNAKEFLEDTESKKLFKLRHSSTKSNLIYAVGCE